MSREVATAHPHCPGVSLRHRFSRFSLEWDLSSWENAYRVDSAYLAALIFTRETALSTDDSTPSFNIQALNARTRDRLVLWILSSCIRIHCLSSP
jgi:hypothetical protein